MSVAVHNSGQAISIDAQERAGSLVTSGNCPSAMSNAPQWIRWQKNSGFELRVIQSAEGNSTDWTVQASELAEVALRTGLIQSRILASPSAGALVAQPIAGFENDCLTVWFPCSLSDINEQKIAGSFLATQKLAELLAGLSNRTNKPASNEDCSAPNLAANSTDIARDSECDRSQIAKTDLESDATIASQKEENAELPTWLELANLSKQKLARFFARSKSNVKFYVIATLVLSGICMLPWPHRVACNVVCEPVVRRYVAAPFDGRLLRSHVVVGQQVSQGEILASFDGGELRSQLAGVQAKRAQAEQREFAALAAGDHSKAGLERLEVEHLSRELEVLESRQSNLEIRSPIDGVVVTGDLERAEGAQLSLGENLFEIASLEKLVAEVSIPESDIAFVDRSMPVSIFLEALQGTRIDTKIEKLHLRSEIRDNESVFIAEAELSNDAKSIRPGMSAKAWISTGYRSLG